MICKECGRTYEIGDVPICRDCGRCYHCGHDLECPITWNNQNNDDRVPAFIAEVERRSKLACPAATPGWVVAENLQVRSHGETANMRETIEWSVKLEGAGRTPPGLWGLFRDPASRFTLCVAPTVSAHREEGRAAPAPPVTFDPRAARLGWEFEQERRVAALPADLDPGIRDAVIEGDDAHEARKLVEFVAERWPEAEVDFTRHFCDDAPGQMFTLALVVWPEVSDV